jgi:hypothetical protein
MYPPNNNLRDHRCANLLRIIDQYPTFEGEQLLPVLRAVIGEWENDAPINRPGFECLNKVWLRGRSHHLGAVVLVPSADRVAAVLSLLIIEGGIDPFERLTPENAREHLLTSKHEPSERLRELLRGNQLVVEGAGVGPSSFVRAIALGFGWRDYLPTGTALRVLVDTATPADLLSGYHIASSLAFDRGLAAQAGDGNFQAIAEGIVESLRQRLRANALQGDAAQFANRVIRIIELGRVVRGMVHLLGQSSQVGAIEESMIEGWFDPQRTVDGPLSHLRSYALLGAPLIDLVGNAVDSEVRRGIERIMEAGAGAIPGFPSDARLSHRPSDLLRRIRFLVRAMVLRSRDPGAHPIFVQFMHGLFAGAGQNLVLSAAKFAFERPSPGQAPGQMRADLHNVLAQAGVFDGGAAAPSPECIQALRTVVSIEVDTWTADATHQGAHDPELLEAVLEELRDLQDQLELEDDEFVREVFDGHLLARAVEELRRKESGTNERRKFFGDLQNDLAGTVQVLRGAIREGKTAFASIVRAHYHREFDDESGGRAGLWRLANEGDVFLAREAGEAHAEECEAFLQNWASVTVSAPVSDFGVDSWTEHDWVAKVRAEPLVRGGPVGAPWIFRAADCAARGGGAALTALRALADADNARQLFQMAAGDAVGRSLGVVIAQTCCAELVDRLFGVHRGFALPLASSLDGVTPVMAAVRFAKDGSADKKRGLERVIRCSVEHGGDMAARDGRGWRAIHHAFAAGHVDAARTLVANDPNAPDVQDGDSTTFLIEALRRTSAAHREGASVMGYARELLAGMTAGQITQVLEFTGPEMIQSTVEGMPLSVVSASVGGDGNWDELMALVQAYPAQSAGIWAQAGAATLRRLASSPDYLQLAQYLGCVGAAGAQHLQQMVQGLPEPLAVRVCTDAGRTDAQDRAGIESSLMKLVNLRQCGVLNINVAAPWGGSMFHELVRSASGARDGRGVAGDAKLYEFASTVFGWAGHAQAAHSVLQRDFDGETAIWQAARWGEWALALAYARALGAAGADRLHAAGKFITSPGDYQGGVDTALRIDVQDGMVTMVLNSRGDRFPVSDKRLPPDLDNGSAQDWLRKNATTIARRLREQLGTQLNVGADEFVNLIAHLVDGEDDAAV